MRAPVFFEIPGGTPPVACKGCGKHVYWIRTLKNKLMPIDVEVDGGYPPNSMERGRGVAHFATCPQAQRFRRASPEARSRVQRMRAHQRAERGRVETAEPGLFESPADVVAAAQLIATHSGIGEGRILTFAEDARAAARAAAGRTFDTPVHNQVREAANALERFHGEQW